MNSSILFTILFSLSSAYALELKDVHVFSKGNINYQYSDIQGSIASGGNINLYKFGFNTFQINGQKIYSASNISLENGRILGKAFSQTYSLKNGSFSRGIFKINQEELDNLYYDLPDKIDYYSDLINIKTDSYSSFTKINESGKILIKAPKENLVSYFSLSLNDFMNAWGIEIEAQASQFVIINIKGKKHSFVNKAIDLVGIEGSHVLFNFPKSNDLTISKSGDYTRTMGIQGSILAPNAKVTFFEGLLSGGLYCKSLSGPYPGGQINPGRFIGWKYLRDIDPK